MKSSQLNALIAGHLTGKSLSGLLVDEVSSYANLSEKRGATIPLRFVEDEDVVINQVGIKRLLQETLIGHLTNIDLAYICDCLTLGDRVEFNTEGLKTLVFEIADPEINGGYKSNAELQSLINNIEDLM